MFMPVGKKMKWGGGVFCTKRWKMWGNFCKKSEKWGCFCTKKQWKMGVFYKKSEKWGCFTVKKVENRGCFVKKWTFFQRRVHYVQYQYFLFLLLWGGAYAPNAPPCLRA